MLISSYSYLCNNEGQSTVKSEHDQSELSHPQQACMSIHVHTKLVYTPTYNQTKRILS